MPSTPRPSRSPKTGNAAVAGGVVVPAAAERPVTLEDLRRKALQVQTLAKAEVRDIAEQESTRLLVGVVVGVAVVVSVAYFMGSRSGRAKAVRAAKRAADRAAKRAAADASAIVRI
jgi:hypothetical protein